jgi:hypothetical protein
MAFAMGRLGVLGWGITAGMKHLVPRVVARMTILAAVGGSHLLVAAHAAQVIGCFQANLVRVVPGIVLCHILEIVGIKALRRMAPLAAHFVGRPAVCVAFGAIFILDRISCRMVVAGGAAAFGHIDMHGMIKDHRLI